MEYTPDDSRTYQLLLQGDEQAFTLVFKNHFRPLCYFAESLTGVKAVAEDIVAAVLAKCWEHPPELRSPEKFKSYLYTATRNAAIDYLRAQKVRGDVHREISYLAEEGEELIEKKLIQAEAFQAIYDEIENLPPQMAEILRLTFMEGMSTTEIVEHLGLAYQTVFNQKSRALKLLRTAMLRKSGMPALVLLASMELLAAAKDQLTAV